jgi:hypothetical protein
MNTLLNLRNDKLINILLKNDCVIYGEYVREYIIRDNEDFYDNYTLKAYTSRFDRTSLERDLYDLNSEKDMDLEVSSTRFNMVKYILNIDNKDIYLNVLYMNRSTMLINNVRPPIILDVDLIQLGRDGIKIDHIPKIYHYSPAPFLYIMDNIKNKRFNIILNYNIFDLLDFQYCRKLEEEGWVNKEAKYEFLENVEEDDNCSICRNSLSESKCIKLKCGHYFHVDCWDKHIEHKMKTNVVLTKISCPLCREDYLIKNII